jgi:mRNA-degrading endonuclease YafQ of YafQ-DinJ toxin-antitoxin module
MKKGIRMPFREVTRVSEFERDFKKLLKKYVTLEEDLDTMVRAQLGAFHKLGLDTGGVFRVEDLGDTTAPVFKVKKFACRTLKSKGSRTGLRLIYAYVESEDRIDLIEIYIKADKETEDRERIRKYYKRR